MNDLLTICAGTLRLATPLILCAMGGLFSERAGVIDVGLEGKMLVAAFAAATIAWATGSGWAGLAGGIVVSCLMALLHGLACITYRGNQVVSGVAINILASGLTMVFAVAWFHMGGQTPGLDTNLRFMPIAGGQSLLVYVALAGVALTWWVVNRTRFGLRLRAAGEEPAALDAAGISVAWMRYRALLVTGVFTGIAGAFLSIGQNANFSREMSAGQGYIALAALIFGKWNPLGAFGACLLFGLLDTLAIRLQGTAILGFAVPVQLIQALPYILTVTLLAGFIGRAVAPKAIGQPYEKAH
jgi:simple sugar transport system permease protein